ncbi:MAG TPA: CAP domain-containing protein [Xanthomonadales bacterium]|nr:CAP domain-containing protein [Xanthomonadales bacterium]
MTDDNGVAVSGATVYVGASLPRNAGPVTSGALTTTGADGSFTVSAIVGANTGVEYNASGGYDFNATWVVVWSKDAALPVYHGSGTLANPTGANALGAAIVLHRLSAADMNAVSAINAYRATQGSGPLAVDEVAVEAANLWAAYVAVHPGVDHSCPSSDPACVSAQRYENAHGERGAGENVGPSPDWNAFIGENESEAANCHPQPAQYGSCSAYAQTSFAAFESVGHWLNLVNPSATWIGVGTAPYSPGYTEFVIETTTL